ncbi:hypothetical protein X805_32060 [Sphaerotilus natans subsp. natans DSM 6575]|jgi:hypothetical protein|uniref:Secreted protein n=2 Tax=Sphaerotilus natans TaxID=34103 RepID=A0A059KIC5_9BURK|nr:hypothetical protein [Sphaerotilus natans]KDB51196.1 hypothetical protein X805_32060 [Sphaerotilus natans subsp. natans DSM 6575]
MFRRLMSLFAVLMLLCAGLLGGAQAAVATVTLVAQADADCRAEADRPLRADEGTPPAALPDRTDPAQESDPVAELADVPPLPGLLPQPHCRGLQRALHPAEGRPQASPYLDGPLRPPRQLA